MRDATQAREFVEVNSDTSRPPSVQEAPETKPNTPQPTPKARPPPVRRRTTVNPEAAAGADGRRVRESLQQGVDPNAASQACAIL